MGIYNSQSLTDKIISDPEKMQLVSITERAISAGQFEKEYMNFIFQEHGWHKDSKIINNYAFAKVHAMILMGHVALCDIEVGNTPSADKSGEEMMRPILQELPSPFNGDFYGGTQDEDGYLKWTDSIIFDRFGYDADKDEIKSPIDVELPMGKAVLEVGTTNCMKTLTQICQSPALARWPYGSTKIRIFCLLPEFRSQYIADFPV